MPAAFVSSGETLVDSISVAGLAGYVDAPILVTPLVVGDTLPASVRDYLAATPQNIRPGALSRPAWALLAHSEP